MVEEEAHCCFTFAIKCGHGLDQLSEVIDCHNDVFMTVGQDRVDCHEVDFPFAETLDCNYRVKWCRGGSFHWGKEMTTAKILDCL